MPTSVPPGFVADASIRAWFCTTLANPAAPSVASEINAGTTIDLTCYLTAGLPLDASVATITDDRLCLKVVLEDKGVATWSIDEIQYIWDPQNAASLSNKVYAGLPENQTGFFVIRYGLDVDTAPAAAQKVWVVPVKMGPPIPLPIERNTKGRVKQKPFVYGVINPNVALAA